MDRAPDFGKASSHDYTGNYIQNITQTHTPNIAVKFHTTSADFQEAAVLVLINGSSFYGVKSLWKDCYDVKARIE